MDKDEAHKQEPVRAWFTANEFIEMAERRTKEWDKQADIPDLIAGALGVSRGTASDLMRDALKEAAPVREDWGPRPHEVHSLPSEPAPVHEHEPENEPYVSLASVQEPVAWMHTNAIGHVYFRKNPQDKTLNPVPLYTQPQPAPVQEPVAKPKLIGWRTADFLNETTDIKQARSWEVHYEVLPIFEGDPNTKLVTPPAAQRQWVGLTDEEWQDLSDRYGMILFGRFKNEIEAKLKERNQ